MSVTSKQAKLNYYYKGRSRLKPRWSEQCRGAFDTSVVEKVDGGGGSVSSPLRLRARCLRLLHSPPSGRSVAAPRSADPRDIVWEPPRGKCTQLVASRRVQAPGPRARIALATCPPCSLSGWASSWRFGSPRVRSARRPRAGRPFGGKVEHVDVDAHTRHSRRAGLPCLFAVFVPSTKSCQSEVSS